MRHGMSSTNAAANAQKFRRRCARHCQPTIDNSAKTFFRISHRRMVDTMTLSAHTQVMKSRINTCQWGFLVPT
jgi:hypothetical protein